MWSVICAARLRQGVQPGNTFVGRILYIAFAMLCVCVCVYVCVCVCVCVFVFHDIPLIVTDFVKNMTCAQNRWTDERAVAGSFLSCSSSLPTLHSIALG